MGSDGAVFIKLLVPQEPASSCSTPKRHKFSTIETSAQYTISQCENHSNTRLRKLGGATYLVPELKLVACTKLVLTIH